MAEGRMLKKRISYSEKFAALKTDKARLLYLMLLPHLDVEGRFEANPQIIKGTVMTLLAITTRKIEDCLADLHTVGLITLYNSGDKQYLKYYRYEDFQYLNKDREAKTEIPDPPSRELREDSETTLGQVKLSEGNISEDKLREKESSRKQFTPPTLEQIKDYIKQNNYDVNAEKFLNYFAESGWVDSKGNKVRNWKQKIITWSGNRGGSGKSAGDSRRDSFAGQESAIGKTV